MTTNPWVRKKLGQFCTIQIGGTPARNIPDYWDITGDSGNLWASIKDLNQRVVQDTLEKITDAGVRNSNAKLVKKGTVLMSFKLTIGRVAFVGRDLYTNEAIAALDSKEVDLDFLFYGLQQWDLLSDVDQAIKGATLNQEKIRRIEAYLPASQSEQIKIAEVLSTIDHAIEQTEALIAKYRRIKAGLMHDLLTRGIDENGDIRDPAAAPKQFRKIDDYSYVPCSWRPSTVEEEFDLATGFTLGQHRHPRRNKRKYLRVANVYREQIILDDLAELEAEDCEMVNRMLKENDLLVVEGHANPEEIGRCGLVPEEAT